MNNRYEQSDISAEKTKVGSALGRVDRRLWPLIILLVTALVLVLLYGTRPRADRDWVETAPAIIVDVLDIHPIDYQMSVESYGTVQPQTQSFLVAQVGGLVTSIGDNFRDGAFISQGDVLLNIDQRDYVADVRISEASLADAVQRHAEELALSEQALVDWERLDLEGEPNDLVRRVPQLEAARARLASAEAALAKAKLNLERTKIVAPFDGRLINSFVDIGQVVSNNSQLAEVYATDYVEVRLPLKDTDIPFVDLPETSREESEPGVQPDVTFFSGFGNGDRWHGKIVRVESTIDAASRQLHVVAQIDDPFASKQTTAIKIGQYVTAEIEGRTLQDVIVVPSEAIYQNSFVYVAEEDTLQRRDIEIRWQSGSESIIASGIEFGDRVVTTPLGQVTSGTRIAVVGELTDEAGEFSGSREFGSDSESESRARSDQADESG